MAPRAPLDLESFADASGFRLVEPSGSGGYGPLVRALQTALDLTRRAETARGAPGGSIEITACEARAVIAALDDVMAKAAATCETLGARV